MFLKRITLCGFKSFCDRVDFDFGPGVTCIVGPNGCGKSNVVDALKWVLGEQSARSLRGRQMTDMIFSGSATRGSSGVAQVDLVFDNRDRALGLDLDEVVISRKLYRSGESEYLLNRGTTRLKDVRELFMDTGVGVDAYSIIEQGRVDVLLQSSPIERRIIFEEAAGISKYKARRREAQRKLERTEQNLLRVADVIEELEKRLRSVKLQAGKARNYREYESRLKELRARFALAEYHRFSERIAQGTSEVEARIDRATALAAQINRQETDEIQITLGLDQLADEVSTTEGSLIRTKSGLAAQRERCEAARKRAQEQQDLLGRTEERTAGDQDRLEQARRQLEQVEATAAAMVEQTEALHARRSETIEQDQSLAREFTEAQAVLEDTKAGIIDLLRKSAQAHNEITRLTTHRESLVSQKGRLSQREAQLQSELETALEQKARFDQRVQEVEALIAEETRKLEEKQAEASRASAVRQELVDQIAMARERHSAMHSRRELLDDLQRNMEGVGAGVRKVLDWKKQDDAPSWLDSVAGLVADLFDVEVDHAKIIEAALGGYDQSLVVTEGEVFLAHRTQLGELPGRLTVLCLDRLPPVVNERDFSGQEGFVARAIDLIRYPQAYDRLARHLFAKTIVVETLDVALAMARQDVAGHRFVTLRGEVVEPDGGIILGSSATGNGLISRKSELHHIGGQIAETDKLIQSLSDQLNRTQAEVSHLDAVQQELRNAIYEGNTDKVEAAAALQALAEQMDRLAGEEPLIAQEVTLIEQQIDEVLEKSTVGHRSLEALERENKEHESQVTSCQQRIDDIVDQRREVQEKLTQVRVEVGQLAEKRAGAAENINTLRRSIHELEGSLETGERDMEQCRARILEAQRALVQGQEQVAQLGLELEELEAAVVGLRRKREEIRLDLEGRSRQVKTARGELADVETERHEHEMALAETTVRRNELARRVLEELAINLQQLYERYESGEDEDWEEVEQQIAELRGKIDRLGNVNLDAIDELEELDQRHQFLASQRDDLVESRRQLEQLIDRLNEESCRRFTEAFEQIRENFRELFRKLFGGGRAEIILEDPDDVLDCGIEIVAQPPGKDLQSISLMSGGEKSMTAIALLMSIFKSRPAPFAILDEVDAALDEVNNDRFNRIVREFVSESQFLIITHSKRTMSMADHLYGITMQEPGVSTRVSVELGDANVA